MTKVSVDPQMHPLQLTCTGDHKLSTLNEMTCGMIGVIRQPQAATLGNNIGTAKDRRRGPQQARLKAL